MGGDFVPNQRLVEADLCEQFGASRASVRAALVELANERLVERVQNRGARFVQSRWTRRSRSARCAWSSKASAPPRPPSASAATRSRS
ncbi:GntR family transcriptional regulator [Lentzea terrae]|uniref:GntR family transcriptional regulator n=1 Tax=Lentzea terrae TaxID=2200761 RepID=UPI001E2AF173|nr:GntR family transcriptional regulator [Lentzea terrae]